MTMAPKQQLIKITKYDTVVIIHEEYEENIENFDTNVQYRFFVMAKISRVVSGIWGEDRSFIVLGRPWM